MTEYIVRPRQLVAHLSARTLLSPSPVFGRAIGKGFAGANFLVGHPVLGSPALAAGGAGALDPAAAAWVAAVVTAGGSVSGSATSGRQKLVNDLVVGLKADGIWAKLDRLYLFAAENTKSALIDMVARAQATETNAPTFAVDTGYTVNAISFVGLNYNPTTDAVHLSQDNCHLGCWNLFNGTQANPLVTDNPSAAFMIYPKYADGKIYTRVHDAWNGLDITDPRGWLAGDRSGSAGRDTYQNGSLFGNVFTGGSAAIHNAPTVLFSGGPCCAVSFGGSLTSANHLAFYNRLRTYMTAVGIPLAAGGALDPATTAWVAAVVTAGGSVSGSATSGRQKLVNDLIVGLKADGIWAKLDRLWVFAAENAKSALIDLVALTTGTLHNGFSGFPPFTADRGYTCDGTGASVTTGFIPATHGVQFTLNTAHASVWCLTAGQSNQPAYTDGTSLIYPRYLDNNAYFRINNDNGGAVSNADGSGFFVADRNAASGAGCILGYRNGSLLLNGVDGASILSPNQLFAWDRDVAAIGAGGTLNSTQQTAYYNRLRTYMTGVGVP